MLGAWTNHRLMNTAGSWLLVEIARIEGQSFDSKTAAIQEGLKLAKQWVDEHASAAKK